MFQDFRCPFTENCNITPVTRRFCQKCRLDKCFNIGMRKEYIMSEEDKVLKRQKIEQNRAKKRPGSDSHKALKLKRESIDESNFDDTSTSLPSVASVASVMSESYFWESDKKYTDLDANKQSTVDSMSPVTAASVPSPSSPPENCDIAGTKTLEMLKDAFHNSANANFSKHDQSVSHNSNDLDAEKNSSSHSNCNSNLNNSHEQEKRHSKPSVKLSESIAILTKLEKKPVNSRESSPSSPSCSKLENNLPSYSAAKPSLEEQKSQSSLAECLDSIKPGNSCTNELLPCVQQKCTEEIVINQKSKEDCTKSSNLASKIMQGAGWLAKIISNPTVISKVIQDQNILAKFITDPEIIKKLISDPQISKVLEETLISQSVPNSPEAITDSSVEVENINNDFILTKTVKEASDNDQNQVQNPILTNLITNQNSGECERPNFGASSSKSSEWNKTPDDVTRDVLQDLQRYR